MKGMEFHSTCSLCGRSVKVGEFANEQDIDGNPYVFDTGSCMKTFRKFQDIYGKGFTTQLSARP
jgi:hypothetical protein